jgi:hypothetical protein
LIQSTWLGGNRFGETDLTDPDFDWDDTDLIILHGLPPEDTPLYDELADRLSAKPFIIFTSADGRPASSDMRALLPVERVAASAPIAVTPVRASEDSRHPILDFVIPEARNLQSLVTADGSYNLSPAAEPLLFARYQRDRTDIPLLVVDESAGERRVVVNASGWYRYQLGRQAESRNLFRELFQNVVSWASTPADERNLRIRPVRSQFSENEPVQIRATLYNEHGEPETGGQIELSVAPSGDDETDPGHTSTYRMRHTGSGNYTADIGQWPQGTYRLTASATSAGRTIGSAETRLFIGSSNIELLNTRRDDATLRSIAEQSGGAFLENADFEVIQQMIDEQELYEMQVDVQTEYSYLRELSTIWFALVLVLLSAEWLLRRDLSLP